MNRTRLKHLCRDGGQYGYNWPASEYVSDGIRLLRTTDLKPEGLLPESEGIFVPPPVPRTHLLEADDILLTRAGTVGRSYLVPCEGAGLTFAGFLVRFRTAALADARFVNYALMATPVQEQVQAEAISSTIQNFNAERYANLELWAPRLEEQRRIADFLDDQVALMDRTITLRKRQADLASEALLARWAERVLGAGQRIPLRRVLRSITDGPFGSALTSGHYSTDGARVIRLGNLGAAKFRGGDAAFIPMDYYSELQQHAVQAGDLLIAGLGDERNPLGRACVAPQGLGAAIVKADCYRVRLDQDKALHTWAAIAISSPPVTDVTRTLSRGSTRARINTDIARDIAIPLPVTAAQRYLVAEHTEDRDAIDAALQRLSRGGSLLGERRQALITAAVTGQFDVTTASTRSVA